MTKIKTLEELKIAMFSKRSVIVPSSPCWCKPCPAAFVLNLQGRVLLQLFHEGMYIYGSRVGEKRNVISWRQFEKTDNMPVSIGGMGGWFGFKKKGQRWKDYIEAIKPEAVPYAEAMKESVIKNNIKYTGSDHQKQENGVPVFDDETIGSFSFRAWGDIMAAIWSDVEKKDYSYTDFYC